jgi:pyruvyltransferase
VIKVYRANTYNVGDSLPEVLISHFLRVEVEAVGRKKKGKLMVIGSEFQEAKAGDVVWGQGIRRTEHYTLKGVKVLAARGRLAEQYIHGLNFPDVYGDPGLLMPLIYKPKAEKKHELGIIPHHTDRDNHPEGHTIPVTLGWKEFIDEIVSCERVVSSSLHGIVLAEAYGIPAEWAIWGAGTQAQYIKYQDYLTGTDRKEQEPGPFPPIGNLKQIQDRLIKALVGYYGKRK